MFAASFTNSPTLVDCSSRPDRDGSLRARPKLEQVDLGGFQAGEILNVDFQFECWLAPQQLTVHAKSGRQQPRLAGRSARFRGGDQERWRASLIYRRGWNGASQGEGASAGQGDACRGWMRRFLQTRPGRALLTAKRTRRASDLARLTGVPKSCVRIVTGATSRIKVVEIGGIGQEKLEDKFFDDLRRCRAVVIVAVCWGPRCSFARRTQPGRLSGRRTELTWPVLIFTLLSSWIGPAAFAGGENAYRNGFAAFWQPAGGWLGLILIALIAGRARRFAQFTVPDLFETRYNVTARAFATIAIVISYTVITSYQFKAGGRIPDLPFRRCTRRRACISSQRS